MAGDLMMRIYAAMAQKERELISERTRAPWPPRGREGGRWAGIRSAVGCRGSYVNGVDRGEDCSGCTQDGRTVELPAGRVRKHSLISID